ncbi:hypothetical protein LOTGIDRAFT_154431 [Lottia gigantea]|uniref:Uncharacterized protein n=1 Tax=Lottia gigantea TaxID=225164 RepID=V4A7V4_LOTGI|nr:hypothetical protein LOTGIDRAFT_154431 [Lottia gigantea]ESO89331.1 hypothetical protein LOTGIDRAFT_154431 [Lottia gigantea]
MSERILRSYDPLAYHVNVVSDLDKRLVMAFKERDNNSIDGMLLTASKMDFDVFICVSDGYHAFILLSPHPNRDTYKIVDPLKMRPEMSSKPEDIPELLLVHQMELCYEDVLAKMYRIRWKITTFVNVKNRIKRAYFIGHYFGLSNVAIQLAGLRASPGRYSVLLDDCVEFAKKSCLEMLVYATNRSTIEKEVKHNIRAATISGFTAEQLSREIQSSAYSLNSILGGVDISSYLIQGKMKFCCILIFILFVLIYPFIVFWLLSDYYKKG